MNFLDKHPSENRMEFTKLKVACKYASIERGCAYRWFTVCCEILFRKKDYFYPWDFAFRTALGGLRAEISIESKWVYSHIKLSYDLEQNVTKVRTQFDMAVNPLWFNINLKTLPLAWCTRQCISAPRMQLSEVPFFYELFWQIMQRAFFSITKYKAAM